MSQFNTSTQQVKIYDTLSDVISVAPNTWIVDAAFGHDNLTWMQDIYIAERNCFKVTRPHYRMLLENGEDQQTLENIGFKMISALESITGHRLSFMVAKFWLDLPGFGCQIHSDHKDILVSYQIYLNVPEDNDQLALPCHGVEFLHVAPRIQVDLKPNHGYINLNTDLKQHEVRRGSGIRTSVMFQYARA